MYIPGFFSLFFLFSKTNSFNTALNIEELNSVHYAIDIANNPVLKSQDWKTEIVRVINKHGQEYVCTLPQVEIPENENKKEEDLLHQLVDISELLKPMEAAPCLIKKKDWWSYEFCYGSVIKQYHLEENKVTGTILILGRYDSEYNWKNSTKTKNKGQKFHTQFYVNGTRCDITGEPRRTEVRFHCEEGVGDYIQQVDEPESCRYVVVIATTRVCHHPYLKPNPNRTPHSISCAPALSQDQYKLYQKLQEDKAKEAEQDLLQLPNSEGEDENEDPKLDSEEKLASTLNENETEEEAKWSIRLVTIPISKKGRLNKPLIETEDDSIISESILNTEAIKNVEGTSREINQIELSESQLIEEEEEKKEEDKSSSPPSSYMNEEEVLETDFNKFMKEFHEGVAEGSKIKEALKNDDSEESSPTDHQNLEKQFETLRSRMGKWMEIQNEEHIQELLQKIRHNLEENVEQLQETASKFPEDSISQYMNELMKMTEKYKKQVTSNMADIEDVGVDEDQRLLDVFNALTETLTEAEVEVLKAKKKINHLEKYFDSKLRVLKEEEPSNTDGLSSTTKNSGDFPLQEEDPESPGSIPSTTNFIPSPSSDELFDPDNEDNDNEEMEEEQRLKEIMDKSKGDTRHVRILNEKSLDESRKTKLEQSIKERLQKSGLDNIGRKIEVKILTPNYLDDDDSDSLSSLSQEETEAFHNMIVNILSASAEELQERERHKNLEANYNFQLEDSDDNQVGEATAENTKNVGENPVEFDNNIGEEIIEKNYLKDLNDLNNDD